MNIFLNKKLFVFFFVFLSVGSFISYTYADNIIPETECFEILSKYADISNVSIDNTIYNLGDYQSFKNNRNPNPKGGYFFRAKRNNIGTINAKKEYLKTQFVSFGKELKGFEFPLQKRGPLGFTIIDSEGEVYPNFSDKIVYTHHLLNGKLLSCNYLTLKPATAGNYDVINTKAWYANGTKESGGIFKMLVGKTSGTIRDRGQTADVILGTQNNSGYKFIVGKAVVPALDVENKHIFSMEITTVAFDNGSRRMNEYLTFPFQVKAMLNMDSSATNKYSVTDLEERFLQYVKEETCLSVPVGKRKYLDKEKCKGRFRAYPIEEKSIVQKEFSLKDFFANFMPVVSAEEIKTDSTKKIDEDDDSDIEETEGAIGEGDIPFYLLEKINKVPDEKFKRFILSSVNDSENKFLNAHSGSKEYAHYAKVFMGCNIPFEERQKIVLDYLKNFDPATWNRNNLTYSNPKFGDCIIPYPDKRHLLKVIPGSFLINQERAQVLQKQADEANTDTVKTQYTDEEIQDIYTVDSIHKKYNEKIALLNQKYNAEKISKTDYDKELEMLKKEKEKEIASIGKKKDSMFTSQSVIIGVMLIAVGLFILGFVFRRKKS
ncbi:hypothetical protein KGV55_03260 [Candidatus Gracilibacteria bacterium]|nr:hypothetical protein [Candidatus Gracilibacteria bacterium]